MKSKNDAIFQAIIYVLTTLVCVVALYPLIYVISASFSNPVRILSGDVVLWPVEFTVASYQRVFASSDILTGYRNTLIYKIKKIEELIGESMDDPYLRHALIFSCLLLRYRELYQKEGVSFSKLNAVKPRQSH